MNEELFRVEGVGEWVIRAPPTVYPPREDTELICSVISRLNKTKKNAVEIGCGSGAVSIVLASLGWNVVSFDVNPVAVSATRDNLDRFGLTDRVRVENSGVLDGIKIPKDTDLLVWNIPYLDPISNDNDKYCGIEEVALADIPESGWGGELLNHVSKEQEFLSPELTILLLLRTSPESLSKISDWEENGWSCRSLDFRRLGDEKIEVFAIWKTGQGADAKKVETCTSTMDEVKKIVGSGWRRVYSNSQTNGRGRRGSRWLSKKGGVSATWTLDESVLQKIPPGVLQVSLGTIVSTTLNAMVKWPNDIVTSDGRKMAGVLIEYSGDEIKVGIGANKNSFRDGPLIASGWEETLGEVHADEVFKNLDRSISSYFEETRIVPFPTAESLICMAWVGLSKLLSRGLIVKKNGFLLRPTGINRYGELVATGPNGCELISDLDETQWKF